jgi:hypothetical protein
MLQNELHNDEGDDGEAEAAVVEQRSLAGQAESFVQQNPLVVLFAMTVAGGMLVMSLSAEVSEPSVAVWFRLTPSLPPPSLLRL